MQGPSFLPQELSYCESFDSDAALFKALINTPAHFIEFFELACEDEPWARDHFGLMKEMLRWAAKSFYTIKLTRPETLRIVKAIQNHLALLQPLLHFRSALYYTVILTVENQEIFANSIIYGAQSSFFSELFQINCFERFHNEWTFPKVPLSQFRIIEQYLYRGTVPDLWRYEKGELLSLMRQAKMWDLQELVKESAYILKRYIDRDNVLDTLLEAHRNYFTEWKDECYEFFNRQQWGLRFLKGRVGELRVEFLDYHEATFELFDKIKKWVTHLAFSRNMSENRQYFGKIIDSCPKLIGVDLSGSNRYANQFDEIPSHIAELNLSACAWLNHTLLKEASLQFSSLRGLEIANNTQLNYLSWGELARFHHLTNLNLSGCYQITDDDLKLIAHACPHVSELNLSECKGIEDKGITDLVHSSHQLTQLNLNYCTTLTDRTLVEIGQYASRLIGLQIVRCLGFTDKGLLQLVRYRHTLNSVDIRQCDFSLKVIEQIRRSHPSVKMMV